MSVNWSKLALFGAGVLAGGAVDHLVVLALRRPTTPYGFRAGARGNAAYAVIDGALAAVLYWLHARSSSPA